MLFATQTEWISPQGSVIGMPLFRVQSLHLKNALFILYLEQKVQYSHGGGLTHVDILRKFLAI